MAAGNTPRFYADGNPKSNVVAHAPHLCNCLGGIMKARESVKGHRRIVLLSMVTALCLVGDSMLYVVLPLYWHEAGLASLWEVGLVLSTNRLARLPLNPLAGWLYTRISTRTGITTATILAVITTFGYAAASGLWIWLGLRVLWGLSWSLLKLGALFAVLETSSDRNRGYLVGTYNGLYRLGSLLGMLGGGLAADFWGFRLTALMCAVIVLPGVALAIFSSPHTAPRSGQKFTVAGKRWAWLRILQSGPLLWALLTSFFVAFVLQGMFASSLSPLVKLHVGNDFSCFGLALGCASLAGLLQALRWGWEPWLAPCLGKLSDQLGRRRLLAASLWVGSLCFASASSSLEVYIWIGMVVCLQLAATSLTTVSDTVVTDMANNLEHGTLVMTCYVFVVDLGAALGPLAAFSMDAVWGLDAVYLGTAAAMTVMACKWTFSPPRLPS